MEQVAVNRKIFDDNELFIFDLDGVVYMGDSPISGAVESINRLRLSGKKIAFFTNNATLSPESYKNKLSGMGISAAASEIYTSALICANSLSQMYREKRVVFLIGEEGFKNALKDKGFSILNDKYKCEEIINNKEINSDFVVVGLDRVGTYEKFAAASLLISRGATFFASNTDPTLPAPSGSLPGAGSIVAFLVAASGKEPEKVFGKPYPEGIFQILKTFSCSAERTVIIGDRLDTDILCGKNAKINTAIVFTGTTKERELQGLTKNSMPDYVLNELSEIFFRS